MPITPFASIPLRTMTQAEFDNSCDGFFGQLNAYGTELNQVETTVLNAQILVDEANAAANAAINAVEVVKWTAASYVEGDLRWSPTNGLTYRAKVGHVSSTDPAGDATNWWLVASTSFGDAEVSRATFRDVGYKFVDKGDSGTVTQTIDLTAGTHQRIRATGAFAIAFANWMPIGTTTEALLELVGDGTARAITFPAGTKFLKFDGSTTTVFSETGITLQSAEGAIDWLYFWTRDAGATLYCKVVR